MIKGVTYSITYAKVTPESAEYGDFSDTGFEVESEVVDSIKELDYLQGNYYFRNPSNLHNLGNGEVKYDYSNLWLTSDSEIEDFSTCETVEYSLHIECENPKRKERILKALIKEWNI